MDFHKWIKSLKTGDTVYVCDMSKDDFPEKHTVDSADDKFVKLDNGVAFDKVSGNSTPASRCQLWSQEQADSYARMIKMIGCD